MSIGNNIKNRRIELNMSAEALAKKIKKNRATIYRYENSDIENLPANILEPLAKALNTTPAYLMGWKEENDEEEYKKVYKVPVYGEIAGGVPLAEIIDVIDYEEVDEHTWNRGELFALRVKGQSMEPRICNGDVVILRKQNTFNDGDICAVRVDDEGATLKKVSSDNTGLYLIPTNESYPTRFFSKKELNEVNIEVLGKVIELRGKF